MTANADGVPSAPPAGSWCDSHLLMIEWLDGPHLALHFETTFTNPPRTERRKLIARWVGSLEVQLGAQHPRGGATAMTWDVTFDRTSEGWDVLADFASHGLIRLRSQTLEVEVVDPRP